MSDETALHRSSAPAMQDRDAILASIRNSRRSSISGIAVRLENYHEIIAVYGYAAAEHALEHVQATLEKLPFIDAREMICRKPSLWGAFPGDLLSKTTPLEEVERQMDELFISLMINPVLGIDPSIRLVLSGECLSQEDASDWMSLHRERSRRPHPITAARAAEYKVDMARAAAFTDHLRQGLITVGWQPIRHAGNSTDILYHEAVPRRMGTGKHDESWPEILSALVNTGLIRLLDRHMVEQALRQLLYDQNVVIGVNISAQSAIYDMMWSNIGAFLKSHPNISSRLMIQINDQDMAVHISSVAKFVGVLRRWGCRFGINDFGYLGGSLRNLVVLKPNMVKISGFFLQYAKMSKSGADFLHHLIAMANTVSPQVVLDGIESEEDARLGSELGATWQQGFHHGMPSIVRRWAAPTA